MKRTILTFLLCMVMVLGITGCSSKDEVSKEDLHNVNNEIIRYFQTNGVKDYDNCIFSYADEENQVVVVGLLDNSDAAQDIFKNNIVDSDLIKFVKGERLGDFTDENMIEAESFLKTYFVLNVVDSNDYKYLYLTIREFQGEEVQTVKVERKLCPDIAEGKFYDFTLKPNYRTQDNIVSIFNNSTVLEIKEADPENIY